MGSYVIGFDGLGRNDIGVVGGKGAHLGELSRVAGVRVPAGFCVTTDAFRRIVADAPSIDERLDRLTRVRPDDREAIRTVSAELRDAVASVTIPDDLAAAIAAAVARLGADAAYAVRSSATAEDLPTASFAGQQDSYLNVMGTAAVLEHISRCWASLFTERAVAYRVEHGIDHRLVQMAVVVQRMVVARASGVMFTADPVTSDRTVVAVEATVGLGEALVSGRVTPGSYRVRDDGIIERSIATKRTSAAPRTSNGAWTMTTSTSSRVDRSRRCSRSR